MEVAERGVQVRAVGHILWECDTSADFYSDHRFELFIPLHMLWLGYMSELLSLSPKPATPSADPTSVMPGTAGMHTKLIKADFHGAIVTGVYALNLRYDLSHFDILPHIPRSALLVRQSKNPCLVGLSGIVVHETENSFKVITRKDEQKSSPSPRLDHIVPSCLTNDAARPASSMYSVAEAEQHLCVRRSALRRICTFCVALRLIRRRRCRRREDDPRHAPHRIRALRKSLLFPRR